MVRAKDVAADALPVVKPNARLTAAAAVERDVLSGRTRLEAEDVCDETQPTETKSFRLTDVSEEAEEEDEDDGAAGNESSKLDGVGAAMVGVGRIRSFKLSDVTEDYSLQEIQSYQLNDLADESDVDGVKEENENGVLDERVREGNDAPRTVPRELKSFRLRDLSIAEDECDGAIGVRSLDFTDRPSQVGCRRGSLAGLHSHPIDAADDDWDGELEVVVMAPVAEPCRPPWHAKLFLPVFAFTGALIVGLGGLDKS